MKTRKACDWCNGLGVLSIRTDQGDNETVTCEKCTYPKAEHTPTPLKMAYEYDDRPITEAMLHEKLGVSLCHAERIIRAVNAHQAMYDALRCVLNAGGLSEAVENAVQEAIAKAEGK